jgi:hypothetical protein
MQKLSSEVSLIVFIFLNVTGWWQRKIQTSMAGCVVITDCEF